MFNQHLPFILPFPTLQQTQTLLGTIGDLIHQTADRFQP